MALKLDLNKDSDLVKLTTTYQTFQFLMAANFATIEKMGTVLKQVHKLDTKNILPQYGNIKNTFDVVLKSLPTVMEESNKFYSDFQDLLNSSGYELIVDSDQFYNKKSLTETFKPI
jgi:CRISPR/Cas system-associated protein endoribonuclease Cas2